MATAWELLIENSSAPDGSTAWEHLNAQEGGGSGGFVLSSVESVSTEIKTSTIDSSIGTVNVSSDVGVAVVDVDYNTEVIDMRINIEEVCDCE
jgi:hypothetical protein